MRTLLSRIACRSTPRQDRAHRHRDTDGDVRWRRSERVQTVLWPPAQAVGNEGVGLPFYPLGDVSVRGSAVGRIVFEAAESWRVMRWCDDDAVRESALATAIVVENRVRDYRGRSVTIVSIDHHVDAIRCQHLQSAGKSGLRERVGVLTHIERTVCSLGSPVVADGLSDGQNMSLVE